MMTKEEFLERELNDYRLDYQAGKERAFHEAFFLCLWNSAPFPKWMHHRLEEMHIKFFHGIGGVGKGSHAPIEKVRRQDEDYAIFGAVTILVDGIKDHRNGNGSIWQLYPDRSATSESAYAIVAEEFSQTHDRIFEPGAIKKTYLRIRKARSSVTQKG